MNPSSQDYPLTLFYDAACPVCALEMDHLRARDRHGQLAFVNIADPGFAPDRWVLAPALRGTVSVDDMRALIHAQTPDGRWVVGTDVFLLAYGAVGLGLWVLPLRLRFLTPLWALLYGWFARHRYGVSRWCMPLIAGLRAWRAKRAAWAASRVLRRSQACARGACPSERPTDRRPL